MRYSATCATKWMIKILAVFILILITLSIRFSSQDYKADNITITTTPSPEEELLIYIKNLSSWKNHNDSQILNAHPFNYLHAPSKICKLNGAVSDPFLLVIVKSYVSNIGHREAIRATWGKSLSPSVKVVFILGHIEFMKSYILIESRRYQDIIQEDFIDVYHNNTVKTIMGFYWAVTTCRESPYILFVDDDYIVNLPNVLKYVRNYYHHGKKVGLYTGYLWEKAYPKRSNASKWYVSTEDYPCKFWPKYIGGGSVLVSMDVASQMKEAFPYIKPIFIDDVYIGIVAATLDVKATMQGKFCPDYHPNKINKLFSTHGVESSSVLIQDWEKVKHLVDLNYV